MADLTGSLSASASGMQAQALRLRYTSENIANVDTPGYRRKTAAFEEAVEAGRETGSVQLGDVMLDKSDLVQIYDPGHPMADTTGHYNGSNVDLVIEIADAREAQRSYEANLKMFDQARQMSASLIDLLRK